MKIVPQRNRHDCGVAALATMLGITYETALETIGRDPAVPVSLEHMTMAQISSVCEQIGVPSDQTVHLGINELEMLHALWKHNSANQPPFHWEGPCSPPPFTFVVNVRHASALEGQWIRLVADQLALPTNHEVETILHEHYGLMVVPQPSGADHWMVFMGEAAIDVSNPWKEQGVDVLYAAWVGGLAHAMIVGD